MIGFHDTVSSLSGSTNSRFPIFKGKRDGLVLPKRKPKSLPNWWRRGPIGAEGRGGAHSKERSIKNNPDVSRLTNYITTPLFEDFPLDQTTNPITRIAPKPDTCMDLALLFVDGGVVGRK